MDSANEDCYVDHSPGSQTGPFDSMPLPNFLIIGAAKSGTTSLWSYLRQHRDVYFSPDKEPNYFALAGESLPDGGPAAPEVIQYLIHRESEQDFDRYRGLFDQVRGQRAIGEASVRYLYYEQAPGRIREALPDVRLIAVLREPAARLYSHYCMNLQYQLEPLPLEEALEAEPDRRSAGWGWDWHYTGVSSYAPQLRRYLAQFDRTQLKVFLHDELVQQPYQVIREACEFLEIDAAFTPDISKREKVTTRPRNLTLDRWLNWPNPWRERVEQIRPRRIPRRVLDRLRELNSAPVPRLQTETQRGLRQRFRDDIEEVEDLLGRRTGWLVA